MSKIVFFDIDGTLLDEEKRLPDSTREAVYALKRSGIFVAIATGRAPFMFEDLRKELEIDAYVSFNGQYVVFENECIYANPLDRLQLKRFIAHAKRHSHPLVFLDEHMMRANANNHSDIQASLASLKYPHPEVDERFYQSRNVYQTLLFCHEGCEEKYASEFPQLRFIRWHPFSVDVLPSGGSKAVGIRKVIERLGFKLKDVYAFGDGLNDIEMLQSVGTGVAMGNASDAVKKHANYITRDVSDNGIWLGLKELNLL